MCPRLAAVLGAAAFALAACGVHQPSESAAGRLTANDPPTGAVHLLGGLDPGSSGASSDGGFELLGGPPSRPASASLAVTASSPGADGFEFADSAVASAVPAAATVQSPPAQDTSAGDLAADRGLVTYARPAFASAPAAGDLAPASRARGPAPLANLMLFTGTLPGAAPSRPARSEPFDLGRLAPLFLGLLLVGAFGTWRRVWLKPRREAPPPSTDAFGRLAP